jgi:hypothetical protein
LNLPAGPGCQRPQATESVPADAVRPIRTEIDGREPSSPLQRGLDETLALATGESEVRLTEGRRGRLGWLQGGGGLSEIPLRIRSLQKEVFEEVRGRARPRGPRVPSKMAMSSRCQRGNEVWGEVQI